MADQNMKVAYRCQWCGDPFHDVDLYWPDHPMHPKQIYVDKEGNQFDSLHCKKMFHGGWGENAGKK
ncbi:MAG: hypothetical protein ABIJ57_03715 [Pseudomonadota bacterium]